VKSVELFVGAGGLALGSARAGFDHSIVVEKDANACRTLRRNQINGVEHVRDWKLIEGVVEDHDFAGFAGTVEFVSGGPPCQPFSLGGKHRGRDDRRDMFPQAVRVVREIRPKAFLFENVKGLLRQNFANYFAYIIHQLRHPEVVREGDEEWTHHLSRLERIHTVGEAVGLTYNVVHQLLDAADCGVPQHRHRVLIVGIRSDLGAEFSFPGATHERDALLHAKWVSGEYWERHRIAKARRPSADPRDRTRIESLRSLSPVMMARPWCTVRDALDGLPRIEVGETCSKIANHFLNPGAKSYPGHTGSPYDEPAKALKAGDHGVPGGENTLRLEDGSVRYLSVRECARLQTFPDEWVFEGSWTESMRQLGNAVPVELATAVASRLIGVLHAGQASNSG